jgi:hypothetical protein
VLFVTAVPEAAMQSKRKIIREQESSQAHARRHGRLVVAEQFHLLVNCRDEVQQRRLYEWLVAKGYACRVLVI